MSELNSDVRSLAHTKWNCKYHIVFAPKSSNEILNAIQIAFTSAKIALSRAISAFYRYIKKVAFTFSIELFATNLLPKQYIPKFDTL